MNLPSLHKSSKIAPLIVALPSDVLEPETKEIIQKLNPVGFILFKRNCKNPEQLKKLCQELRQLCPLNQPLIFIDQEGGRVVRIDFEDYIAPAAIHFGRLYKKDPEKALDLTRKSSYVLAAQLQEYGITVNCLPVADVAIEGAHDVIGDRSFSRDPKEVAVLCAASMSGLFAGGNFPIIKHAPGHGRAFADSHKELPIVDETEEHLMQTDFVPFAQNAKSPFIMTAHIKYPQIDNENCATNSSYILHEVMRKKLGMTGVIVSDDLNMEALSGSIPERAVKAYNAGCELLLHCSGDLEEMASLIGLLEIRSETLDKLNRLPQIPTVDKSYVDTCKEDLKQFVNSIS